jgi:hypothetical protein
MLPFSIVHSQGPIGKGVGESRGLEPRGAAVLPGIDPSHKTSPLGSTPDFLL